MPHVGSCLCGNVRVEVATDFKMQFTCHCNDCQRTSGTAFSSNIMPKEADVTFTGDVKKYESKAESGNTVTRMFCGTCGSPVAHKSVLHGDCIAVQTGTMPDFQKIPVIVELFTRSRWGTIPAVSTAGQFDTMPPT